MNNGLFHELARCVVFTSGFVLSISSFAQTSTPQLHKSFDVTKQSQKVFGGSYSINRLKGSSRKKFVNRNLNKVRLNSKVPRNMAISNYDVSWKVKSAKGRNVVNARGKQANISLAPGKYYVALKIGTYTEKKTIQVRKSRNNIQSFSLPVRAGIIKASANNPNKSLKMYVKDTKGNIIASSQNGKGIKQVLKSGTYVVETVYNKKRNRNVVVVKPGSVNNTTIDMPKARQVKLRALKHNSEPLLKKSSWVITDQQGNVVKKSKRHTVRVNLYPGRYTAKVKVNGAVFTKSFNVLSSRKSHDINVKI